MLVFRNCNGEDYFLINDGAGGFFQVMFMDAVTPPVCQNRAAWTGIEEAVDESECADRIDARFRNEYYTLPIHSSTGAGGEVVDWNSDGFPDVMVFTRNFLLLLTNDGHGNFASKTFGSFAFDETLQSWAPAYYLIDSVPDVGRGTHNNYAGGQTVPNETREYHRRHGYFRNLNGRPANRDFNVEATTLFVFGVPGTNRVIDLNSDGELPILPRAPVCPAA